MNHNQLKRALDGSALVAYKQDAVYFSSNQRGIAPLVALCAISEQRDELSLADKVIGKAAALLCAQCGVKVLYAKVISEAALIVLAKYEIDVKYGERVPFIKNRQGSGKCPMEKLAQDVDEPDQMLVRAQKFIAKLNS